MLRCCYSRLENERGRQAYERTTLPLIPGKKRPFRPAAHGAARVRSRPSERAFRRDSRLSTRVDNYALDRKESER